MSARIEPAALKAALRDGAELALLDVREEGPFAGSHLLFATSLPLSQLELRIRDLVPRLGTRVVLLDDDEGLAERAAERLTGCGYTDVAVLTGGNPAWQAAGYELFSGVNVPSKAFGEFVEHAYETPAVDPEQLSAWVAEGRDLVILDSRPMEEYTVMNIPGGVNVPGAELVHRVRDIAPDPETLVVVNCAGRTRSIIGAQSLINAGTPNPVVALRNGTMGWHLAGLKLERGNRRTADPPGGEALTHARAAAQRVAERFGVQRIDAATLRQWEAEAARRSLYVLDVRLPDEYEAGHLPGSRNAPGGQLVQATDTYIGTRNSRVVLVDDTEVRATMTASWLVQMGWQDVRVLAGGLPPEGRVPGPHRPEVPGLAASAAPTCAPAELEPLLAAGAVLIDLAPSPDYTRGHIAGAWFAIRAELPAALERAGSPAAVVLTSPDGVLAGLAAPEATEAGVADVRVLAGGTAAWVAAGHALEAGEQRMASEPRDVFPKPYHHPSGVEDAMRAYLSWEVALVNQIRADGDAEFKVYP